MSLLPVVFTEGASFYDDLARSYIRHAQGFFILAPSGVGKTHFCKAQAEPHWIDGDDLWVGAGAQPHPSEKWWTQGIEVINRVDQRSDVITVEAKLQGFWIMGASNYWLKPDAIVVPDWNIHVGYIKHRQEQAYDGGATTDALGQVQEHIAVIRRWHTDHGVPEYQSIEEAVEALTAGI